MCLGVRYLAACVLLAATPAAHGADGFAFASGFGAAGIRPGNGGSLLQLGLHWDWRRKWRWGEGLAFDGRFELSAGMLSEDDDLGGGSRIADIGTAAVLRGVHHVDRFGGFLGFGEFGTGPHWFSNTRLDGTEVSTHLQFGSFAGFGIVLSSQVEFGYRLLHLSNAGIENPNPGLNYHVFRVGFGWP